MALFKSKPTGAQVVGGTLATGALLCIGWKLGELAVALVDLGISKAAEAARKRAEDSDYYEARPQPRA